jgi:hypothetical protein
MGIIVEAVLEFVVRDVVGTRPRSPAAAGNRSRTGGVGPT